MLGIEEKISLILYFIEKKEANEASIADFKLLLNELNSKIPLIDLVLASDYTRKNGISLVGFCFLQDQLKIEFVDCILDIAPDLLIGFRESESRNYEYAIRKQKSDEHYTVNEVSSWERCYRFITPIIIAALFKDKTKINAILTHVQYKEFARINEGYEWCIYSYTKVIEGLHIQDEKDMETINEILNILLLDIYNLTFKLGKKADIGFFNKKIKFIQNSLKEINSKEACEYLYIRSSILIKRFYEGYKLSGWYLFYYDGAIKKHDKFCREIIFQRTLETHVINIFNLIRKEEETDANIEKLKLLLENLKSLGVDIEEIQIRDIFFISLAGVCFRSKERKMQFLNCILNMAPELLIRHSVNQFTYNFTPHGLNPADPSLGLYSIRLITDMSNYASFCHYSLIDRAIEYRDLVLAKTIIDHPKLTKVLERYPEDLSQLKFIYYVRAFTGFHRKQKECGEREDTFLKCFGFEDAVKNMLSCGIDGKKDSLGRLINWIPNSYVRESNIEDKVCRQILKPLAYNFLLGSFFQNLAPQVITLIACKNRGVENTDKNLLLCIVNLVISSNVDVYNKTQAPLLTLSFNKLCSVDSSELERSNSNKANVDNYRGFGILLLGVAVILSLGIFAYFMLRDKQVIEL